MTFAPFDRAVRAAFVGLGRIYDLNMRAYVDNPDVEVVALVDPSEERRAQRQADWPAARTFASVAELAASGLEVDAVEALLPIPLHVEGVIELLGHGWHVNLQKPMCNDLADARRMLDAAEATDRQLRVMENYIFYEPLVRLKEIVGSGEIGEVSGYHMKMVASGLGGWDVPASSYEWQFKQMQQGPGHPRVRRRVAQAGHRHLALRPDQGGAGLGGRAPRSCPGIEIDAPTTIVWEHENGIRGVWDITLAIDMYLRSDYYTNDERWEVTGRRGYARVNRCTGRGIQQPSLEVYADGEMRSFHALDDDWASSFRDSGRHWLRWLHTGEGPMLWSGDEAVDVLRFALAAYASSAGGRHRRRSRRRVDRTAAALAHRPARGPACPPGSELRRGATVPPGIDRAVAPRGDPWPSASSSGQPAASVGRPSPGSWPTPNSSWWDAGSTVADKAGRDVGELCGRTAHRHRRHRRRRPAARARRRLRHLLAGHGRSARWWPGCWHRGRTWSPP